VYSDVPNGLEVLVEEEDVLGDRLGEDSRRIVELRLPVRRRVLSRGQTQRNDSLKTLYIPVHAGRTISRFEIHRKVTYHSPKL
jgi:hypothetical protein